MPVPRRRRRLAPLLALALLAAAPGCAVLEPSPLAAERAALERARARWRQVGPASYRYVFTPSCECPPSVSRSTWVTVSGGVVTEAAYVDGGAPVNVGPDTYRSVEALFGLLEQAYRERAAVVRVRYAADFGHPEQVFIDWNATAVDDEYGFTVSVLEALEALQAPPQ